MAVSWSFKGAKKNIGEMMKKRDIRKIIQLNIESHIPKESPKIDFPFVIEQKVSIEKRKFSPNLKYSLSTGLAVLVLILAFALWPRGTVDPMDPIKLLNSDQEVISFSAVSSISLLSNTEFVELTNQSSDTLLSKLNHAEMRNLSAFPLLTPKPDVIAKVLPYLKTAEQLLLSDNGLNIVTGISDLEEYDYFMQFETKNLIGITTVYIMHYNMVMIEQNDEESEYSIEGLLFFGSQIYTVSGEKEIEEDSEKVKFRAYKDQSNYVESVYEVESDEEKFEFKVVQNNITISESKYEIDYDGKETKIKIEFFEGSNRGNFEFEYYTQNQTNYIEVEFSIDVNGIKTSGEMLVQMLINELTGSTFYRILVNPNEDDEYEYDVEDDDDDDEEDEDEEETEEDSEDSLDEEDSEDTEEYEDSHDENSQDERTTFVI